MAPALVALADAAEQLGYAPQWLRRHLLKQQAKGRPPILVDVGEGKQRPTYALNVGLLRRHYPELFDPEARLARSVTTSIGRLLAPIQTQLEDLNARTAALTDVVRKQGRR